MRNSEERERLMPRDEGRLVKPQKSFLNNRYALVGAILQGMPIIGAYWTYHALNEGDKQREYNEKLAKEIGAEAPPKRKSWATKYKTAVAVATLLFPPIGLVAWAASRRERTRQRAYTKELENAAKMGASNNQSFPPGNAPQQSQYQGQSQNQQMGFGGYGATHTNGQANTQPSQNMTQGHQNQNQPGISTSQQNEEERKKNERKKHWLRSNTKSFLFLFAISAITGGVGLIPGLIYVAYKRNSDRKKEKEWKKQHNNASNYYANNSFYNNQQFGQQVQNAQPSQNASQVTSQVFNKNDYPPKVQENVSKMRSSLVAQPSKAPPKAPPLPMQKRQLDLGRQNGQSVV